MIKFIIFENHKKINYMKIFFINFILPIIILFIGFIILMPIAFTLSFTIDSSAFKEKISYGLGFLLSIVLGWYILSNLFKYWKFHSSYNNFSIKGIIIGIVALIVFFKILQYVLPVLFPNSFRRF